MNIPTPKHQLNRYSTKQLKAWHEECALIEFESVAASEGNERSPFGKCLTATESARWMRWGIDDVLQGRGVSHLELGRMYRAAREDVLS